MRLTLQLAPADPAGLAALADALARPGDPANGPLEREALAGRVALTPPQRAALRAWLAEAGLAARAGGLGDQRWTTELGPRALARLLGEAAARTLIARRRLHGADARALVPADLAPRVAALEVGPAGAPAAPRGLADPGGGPRAADMIGLTPAELARGYGCSRELDGDGECVAVMALGGVPDAADLHGFARAFDLPPPRVELVPLTPLGACADDPRHRLETTMGLQWLAAVAPRARIVVYLIDPGLVADPWAEFLFAVLSDRSRRPSVAVTSWSAPARQYYAVHGRAHFAGLLDQAALAGITVIAASGDWGAYDGFPSAGPGRDLCADLGPHDTFPGAEPRVLSVGGTQVTGLSPWREVAWSAPVSPALRAAIGLGELAGGGGVSAQVPVPDYQRACLPASFSRGPDAPASLPTGRVQPDVALMAWGPDAADPAGPRPGAYACLFDGAPRDDAGGTSVAAPIWAALVARINQARVRAGRARLGWLHPRLYRASAATPGLLRDITEGRTDITLPIAGPDGAREWRRLPGYQAGPGFDPAAGLGVPHVPRLEALLASSP